ncbi:Enoyl-CoA hydratase [Salix suchowensis]|nr:Enoyl-CoA hydratase [Salix suchowensis]
MLDQPPVTVHPVDDEDVFSPPTSPKLGPSKHPHVLPNGVRLRLSLGTMINDFFARQAPPPPYRYQQRMKDDKEIATPVDSRQLLPPALEKLSSISSSPASSDIPHYARPEPTDRVFALYTAGADPSTANAPPALRCPRHLHTSCEICVEAKSRTKLGQSGGGNRHSSYSKSPMVTHSTPGSTPQAWAPSPSVYTPSSSAGTGAGNAKLSELIPRFMRLSALVALELGREMEEDRLSMAGSTSGSNQPPSFASSSRDRGGSFIASDVPPTSPVLRRASFSSNAPPVSQTPNLASASQSKMAPYAYALQPSREWYLLTSGLLTRAALEGYLTAGWRGVEAIECLLTVGLGMSGSDEFSDDSEASTSEDDHSKEGGTEDPSSKTFEDFDPDDLPALQDATRILFLPYDTTKIPALDQPRIEVKDR